jgi:hypothetical protein
MFQFPNPLNNWVNSLNDAVKELNGLFNGLIATVTREILTAIERSRIEIMAELDNLKSVVAANEATTTEIGVKLAEVGVKLATEADELKTLIKSLEDKVNFDVLGLQGEVDKLSASTAKLGTLGSDIETLGNSISELVTLETPVPVPPVEPPVE